MLLSNQLNLVYFFPGPLLPNPLLLLPGAVEDDRQLITATNTSSTIKADKEHPTTNISGSFEDKEITNAIKPWCH